jgi:hypothetical protein
MEGIPDETESLYIVYDLTFNNAELISTKSDLGSSLLPIKLGDSSQELEKNKMLPKNARRKVLVICSEDDLR